MKWITIITPMSYFYTFGFLPFSGGIEIGHKRENGEPVSKIYHLPVPLYEIHR